MPRTFRTLLSLAARAVARPEDRFVGEAGRRITSSIVFVLVGWGVFWLSPHWERFGLAATAGWVAAAACYLSLAWAFVLGATPERTRAWALAQDAPRSRVLRGVFGRTAGLSVVVLASAAGLLTATGLLEGGGGLLRILSGLAVILAWLLLQTSYGLHYAYVYYHGGGPDSGPDGGPDEAGGGLDFPGEGEPGLVDFAYFAFAVGTAFAVSDVKATSTPVRRVVIGHSLLSFAYNAAILTLAFGTVLNVAPG